MALKVTDKKSARANFRNVLSINEGWQFRKAGTTQWYDTTVPSTNFTDLLKHGLIDDPFYRDNETKLQWIENEDWEYQLNFEVKPEDLEYDVVNLVFDGLDTYADVYVNGTLIFKSDNMFVKWQHDCKQLLKVGSNELKLYFHSPIKVTRPLYEKAGFTYPAGNDKSDDKLSVYSRKAPYHFGWDWGPRFVTSGIWRPVYLEAWNDLEIADLYVEQNALTEKRAVITAHVEINAVESQSIDLQLSATSPEGTGVDVKKEHVSLQKGKNNISLTATISDPRRWWPNGMGEPNIYKIKVKVQKDGQTAAEKHLKVGLRTIEVINKPDGDGESFFVKVNDTPVFIKGANYIPSDSFLDRVTSEKYREVFDNAVNANMNMLRVWGGGFYENDEFYDLADERGIMIWQDFMFACSMYPGDDAFLKNVEKEAVYNVKRLRNHPSIALWCGNNEIAIGWVSWGWQKEFGYDNVTQILLKKYYNNLFHKLLPNVVKALDPEKFYLPSSPISDWKKLDDLKIGNNHYWGVWHGELPFSSYNTYVPRFMSEYGFQSFPDIDSVKKYTEQEDWDLMSPVMLLHQKHPRGNALIKKYMEEHYSQPKNFEAFLYLSQLLQAEGIKTAIHAHRRNKPFCMGTLYWQLNDCWPVASWSSVDYYGRWKALQFFVKTAYQEIIASTIQEDDHIEVFVISDSLVPQKVVLEVDVLDFSGKKVYEGRHNLNIAENSSKAVCKTTVKQLIDGKDKASHMLTARIVRDGEVIYEDNHYFVEPKAIKWKRPEIETKFRQEAGMTVIELSANVLARNVCLKASGFENNFSDNYFDLVPGRKKTVTINTDDHFGLEKDLTVYSLYDACIEI
ncbi:hypothetical protein LVD17_02470 [Fulvivirga ulvae]|uniref:beta-mannosidase n=1 Tax=Fulvivirga ulvae TaxID=2904245 RepID=UPI001F3D7224|nr:glycoside hydrolase family 2 protein [Fulvivirga ulvae]UII32699.1 hypothetical protein LVD17_02470 [Fulvivirga ulvae]